MAITPTGAIFKSLTFDGEDSRDYGVYITGAGVFNAPERDVEMISIPGRNGAFAMDNGRFSNIEVTYTAGVYAETEQDFADAISDFRNMLCSRVGYCRLSDEYNPNEYRMAVYKSGLDAEVAQLKAGEFQIVFDCKPQRFLTSGEVATAVADGGTLTNPSPFGSSPLLQVWGYGDIGINGELIAVANVPVGNILYTPTTYRAIVWGNRSTINPGDTIYVNAGSTVTLRFMGNEYDELAMTNISFNTTESSAQVEAKIEGSDAIIRITYPSALFTDGTAQYIQTNVVNFTISYTYKGVAYSYSSSMEARLTYFANGSIAVSTSGPYAQPPNPITWDDTNYMIAESTAFCTFSALGSPLIIDLDIGEAYKIENGEVISSNSGVSLPAELPKLKAGTNTFTYDNTVTQFKVVPRWWKI